MMYMLLVFFGILTAVFGLWGFGPWTAPVWASAEVLFWVCLPIFLLLLGFTIWARKRPYGQPLP